MGDFTFESVTTAISPAWLFKALVLDADNLIPKIVPQTIKDVELIDGDGGPGSIRKITFEEGSQVKHVKLKIEAMDEKDFSVNFSLIKGDALMNKIEKNSYHIKFIAAPDGGSISKISSSGHYTTGDMYIKEEDVKAEKEWFRGLIRAVEAYLVANRDACKIKVY